MTKSLKKYVIVFAISGLVFSFIGLLMDLAKDTPFNPVRFFGDLVMYGVLGIVVYYISIVLPGKGKRQDKQRQ